MIMDIARFSSTKHTADQGWDWGPVMWEALVKAELTGLRCKVRATRMNDGSWSYRSSVVRDV